MTDYQSQAEEVYAQLPNDLEVQKEEIAESIQNLHENFGVPLDEATRTAMRTLREDYDGDGEFGQQPAQDQDIAINELTVDHDDEWVNIRGTVQELYSLTDAQAEWMAQRGRIGDDTGVTTFTIPQDAADENPDLLLEEGDTVKLDGVVGDAYEQNISVMASTSTTVETLDESFKPPESDTSFMGCIITLQANSGLIKRCSDDDCTRVVSNNDDDRCPVHGEAEDAEYDMRLKTIIDDGKNSHAVYFDRELTEELTGIDMEEARQMSHDAMDIDAPANAMRPKLVGRHYRIEGDRVGEYIVVNEATRIDRDWQTEGQTLIDSLTNLEQEVSS